MLPLYLNNAMLIFKNGEGFNSGRGNQTNVQMLSFLDTMTINMIRCLAVIVPHPTAGRMPSLLGQI